MRRPRPATPAVPRLPARRCLGSAQGRPNAGHLLLVAVGWAVLAGSGCGELRGRRNIREGNRLYREGHYADAVAAYGAAEALVPGLPHLWLNKGIACRQLMVPGAQTPENNRAVSCAIDAFDHLRTIKPADPRGEQLYLQTLFDADRFDALVAFYRQRLAQKPTDLAAVNGLVQVYSRWNRMEEALEWYRRRAALEPGDAEAQYAVGVYLWQELFKKGGGPEKAAFDPRAAAAIPSGKRSRRARAVAPRPAPPSFGLGDISGGQRAALADLGIAYLEKALALRPKYREAMVYLNLLYRQKSFAYLEDPVRWQAAIDAAERWRRQVETQTPPPPSP
jgi:tetratricopeptide (TPR) repeat protein